MPKGIIMTDGFYVASKKPADLKFIANTLEERNNYVTDNVAYEGMLVYVSEDEKVYQLKKNNTWKEFGFNQDEFISNVYDGLNSDSSTLALSARQGKVLNNIITTHSADNIKHITVEERNKWDAKAENIVATQSNNGLMSAADKKKLDSVETGATNYKHPDTHPAGMIDEDSTHRFVSDSEKETWNAKADTTAVTTEANGLMSKEDKKKLDGIEEGANKYVHPNDANTRHVTDKEKETWNAKADTSVATQSNNGLMSSTDKAKLDGISAGANNYVHPNDENTRHVSDAQIAAWTAKADNTLASTSTNGLMSKEDKVNLNTLIEKMNNMEQLYESMLAKLKTAVFIDNE